MSAASAQWVTLAPSSDRYGTAPNISPKLLRLAIASTVAAIGLLILLKRTDIALFALIAIWLTLAWGLALFAARRDRAFRALRVEVSKSQPAPTDRVACQLTLRGQTMPARLSVALVQRERKWEPTLGRRARHLDTSLTPVAHAQGAFQPGSEHSMVWLGDLEIPTTIRPAHQSSGYALDWGLLVIVEGPGRLPINAFYPYPVA